MNARKSTGPKSAEGKAKSRMNAFKHGLLAREVVVRGFGSTPGNKRASLRRCTKCIASIWSRWGRWRR